MRKVHCQKALKGFNFPMISRYLKKTRTTIFRKRIQRAIRIKIYQETLAQRITTFQFNQITLAKKES